MYNTISIGCVQFGFQLWFFLLVSLFRFEIVVSFYLFIGRSNIQVL